jgi:uncharacterized membrane protein
MLRQFGRWGLFSLFVLVSISGAYGQEKVAVADSYHVEIRVLADGSLEVTERLYMSFQGTFRKSSWEIALRRTDRIEVLEVGEEGRPYERGHGEKDYTYVVEENKDYVRVRWYYPELTDDKRIFYIRYRAIGAVRRYEGGDQVWWKALPKKHGYEIRQSRVVVYLPEGAVVQRAEAYGLARYMVEEGGKVVRFEAERPLVADESFEVRVQFAHGIISPEVPAWQAEKERMKVAVADSYHVEIRVLADGSLEVTERLYMSFQGTFRRGSWEISLRRTDGVEVLEVGEEGRPYERGHGEKDYTYVVEENKDYVRVRWYYPKVTDDKRTFYIRYRAIGAVRRYEGGDQVWWKALPEKHGYEIRQSRVVVYLPEGAVVERAEAYGPARYMVEGGGKVVRFEAERPLWADESFEVRVQFPHGIISPEVPAWQAKGERIEEEEERRQAMFLVAIGILFVAMTSVGAYGVWVWVRKYREPYVFDKPDILKEPPYLDPPGMVGALMDQEVEMRHILATLVDLAWRGIVTIEEVGAGEKDYVIRFIGGASVAKENREIEERLEPKASVKVKAYELKLLNALFRGKPVRRLSELKYKFYTSIPAIKASLWNALVEAGWAVHPPVVVRGLFSALFVIGIWGIILWGIITGLAFGIYIILLGVVALGLLIVWGRMLEWSYRTRAGAERAARWQAFAKWLKALHEINPAEAKAQLEAYLPYAIAFGIEKEFLARWLAIAPDTPPPSWYRSISSYGSMRSTSSASDRSSWGSMENTGIEGRGGGSSSLDSLADSLTGSLNSFASSLSGMLNATARILSSSPPFSSGGGRNGSSGGWSGGGSRGGGGGGGSSSSFD